MMTNSQLLIIVAIAMVAGIILFRLYAVLGRRTGHERDPNERLRRLGGAPQGPADSKMLPLADRGNDTVIAGAITIPRDAERGLMDIKLADRNFETDRFVAGAKKAHELIVLAFARGDRAALKPLLGGEVYAAFDRVIGERAARHETVSFTLTGYQDVAITGATLKNRTAEITVRFQFQFISSTLDAAGAVVDGDPANARNASDLWTFMREIGARDPNWTLVETSGSDD